MRPEETIKGAVSRRGPHEAREAHLLNAVTRIGEDLELILACEWRSERQWRHRGEDLRDCELALHLSNHELFVEALGASEHEQLGCSAGEELAREPSEPAFGIKKSVSITPWSYERNAPRQNGSVAARSARQMNGSSGVGVAAEVSFSSGGTEIRADCRLLRVLVRTLWGRQRSAEGERTTEGDSLPLNSILDG